MSGGERQDRQGKKLEHLISWEWIIVSDLCYAAASSSLDHALHIHP